MKQLRTWRRSPDTIEPWGVFVSLCAISDMFPHILHCWSQNVSNTNPHLTDYAICRATIQKEMHISHKAPWLRVKINPVSTYLHIIWRWFITCSLEGLRHIAEDLHRRQQVTGVEVPPLGEVKQVFRDLGHPIPGKHSLALCKVPLNLQIQEKTELGASVSSGYTTSYTFWIKWSAKNEEERRDPLRPFMWQLYLSRAKMCPASRTF